MKTIGIFTTTRAEFGILCPLIEQISKDDVLDYKLFVGGQHLSKNYGHTIDEIREQGFLITKTFNFISNKDDSHSLVLAVSKELESLSFIFKNHSFDYVCILGDRFELIAVVTSAILFKKPIIHISGGERSEGVIDEQIRHMFTKAAHLHFTACKEYADNICKMGEPSWRIYNTGALGIDNIVKKPRISKEDICSILGLSIDKPLAVLTYHPVTLEFEISLEEQITNIFEALNHFDLQLVVTGPNVEVNRHKIVKGIKKEVKKKSNYRYVDSLGYQRYHSLIPHCESVIGNSSSGIIEVPFFKIPTVNIGDRQKGRIRHESVIDTDYSVESIKAGVKKALSVNFQSSLKDMKFKFGDGHAAERMVEIIRKIDINQEFLRKQLVFK